MNTSSHHLLQVYETDKTFSLDTAVQYEKETATLTEESRAFHDSLITLTQIAGRIPLGLLQRYGLDPLETYQSAPDTKEGKLLRDIMERSVQTEIAIWTCLRDGQKLLAEEKGTVTKNSAVENFPADAKRPYAIF